MIQLEQLIGLGGAIVIRELIEVIKPAYQYSKWAGLINVTASIIFGVILNVALAVALKNPISFGIAVGVVAGLLSPVWNVIIRKE